MRGFRMSEIKQQGKHYLVKSDYGSYTFNNRKTAEKLNNTLNDYEHINKQHKTTEQKLDHITKQLIQIRMTTSILTEEIDKIMEQTR